MGDLVCSHAECSAGDPVLVLTSAATAIDASAMRIHQQEKEEYTLCLHALSARSVLRMHREVRFAVAPSFLLALRSYPVQVSGIQKGGLPRPKALSR